VIRLRFEELALDVSWMFEVQSSKLEALCFARIPSKERTTTLTAVNFDESLLRPPAMRARFSFRVRFSA